MNRGFEYIPLFVICVLTFVVIGCATHTIQHDQDVEDFFSPWLNQSFEVFLEKHPDPKHSIPIGQGNYRHTYVYDIESQTEIGINLLAAMGDTDTGHDDYYHIYVFVNSDGVIYKMDYRRKTEAW